jgi:hypothetical protein
MSNKSVYILARKSMTVHFYTHSIAKRAKGVALVDSGATENFTSLGYAKWLRLPIKKLAFEWNLYNMDGKENKAANSNTIQTWRCKQDQDMSKWGSFWWT